MRLKKAFDSGEFDSFFNQNFKSLKCSAFTLTEVLLAVTIVGIIAALVLPATVSKFNDNILNTAHKRIKESVQNALDSLVVTENKTSFFTTSMYSLTEPENYDNSSGKFLKRNFRVSKYCDGENRAECFSKEYYTTNGTKREIYTPKYEGSCAILKSGASICIAPQIALDKPVRGIVDVNGIKGPNVFGRDLRQFVIDLKIRTTKLAEVEEVNLTPNPKLEEVEEPPPPPPPPPDPCEENPTGLECCKTKATLDAGDACCGYSEMKKIHDACNIKTVIGELRFGCFGYDYSGRSNPNVPSTCTFYGENLPSGENFYYTSNLGSGSAIPESGSINQSFNFVMKTGGPYLSSLGLSSEKHSYSACQYSSLDRPNKDYCGGGSCLPRQDVRIYLELEYLANKSGEFISYTGKVACYVYGDVSGSSSSVYIRGRSGKPE